jgi:threonine/homoserine/homoserine lactone efflux protein
VFAQMDGRGQGQGEAVVRALRIGGWLGRRQAARRRLDVATGGIFIGLGVRLAAER